MTTQEAVKKLIDELKTDNGYWFSWQSNIAMAYKDELSRRGYKLPDQHDIANVAAINFLKQLTHELSEEVRSEETTARTN